MDQSPKIDLLTLALARSGGGGGGVSDVKVDNTSVVDEEGNVNLVTKTAYNATTNKLATESDVNSKVYMHMFYLSFVNNYPQWRVKGIIYNTNPTAFTEATLKTALEEICGGKTTSIDQSIEKGLPVVSSAYNNPNGASVNNRVYTEFYLSVQSQGFLNLVYIYNDLTTDGSTITITQGRNVIQSTINFISDRVIEMK